MEAATAGAGPGRQEHLLQHGLQPLGGGFSLTPGIPGLDVVRALHQTVISLRTALDSSREELHRLKTKAASVTHQPQQHQHRQPPPLDRSTEAVERLALENHLLRRRLLSKTGEYFNDAATSPPSNTTNLDERLFIITAKSESEPQKMSDPKLSMHNSSEETRDKNTTSASTPAPPPTPTPELQVVASVSGGLDELECKSPSQDSLVGSKSEPQPEISKIKQTDQPDSIGSENESEELDDIELIFTTDDTCRDVCLQEDLVSITDAENWQQQQMTPTPTEHRKAILKTEQMKSTESEGELVCNDSTSTSNEKRSSVDEVASSQSSSIDPEESVDRFDESSSSRLNKMWSQCSVLVETDISKCGVLEEVDLEKRAARRNTLAAPPAYRYERYPTSTATYRPIIHREALAAGRRKSATPLRPVIDKTRPEEGARRESGVQTDISAIPAQWRSESYLAHKVATAFTTLPSKFALPAGVPGRLRLSYKTREAKRVMLSDINFTSMVPELSRSADHLCLEAQNQFPQGHSYIARGGCELRTPESHRRESWNRSGLTSVAGSSSPCDCRLSTDLYSTRYRGSLSSVTTPMSEQGPLRRHSWRPQAASSFDGWRVPVVTSGSQTPAGVPFTTWSSMPSSPTHVQPPSAALIARLTGNSSRRTRSKVTFQDCPINRGSLPNLRSEILGDNSGDSTESLIDEAEDYLRRSIDSMLTISTSAEQSGSKHLSRRRKTRRHSEPDLYREWNLPRDARPYLPKIPQDLKLDHIVKVISPEGKILQGRVRYVGLISGREDMHVGVELRTDNGVSDGTFNGKRYFYCDRAIIVPFKKVVLAWCTT